MTKKAKEKLIVGVVVAVVTLVTWVIYHEYEKWRDHKPTMKEKASSVIDKVKKGWEKRKDK